MEEVPRVSRNPILHVQILLNVSESLKSVSHRAFSIIGFYSILWKTTLNKESDNQSIT